MENILNLCRGMEVVSFAVGDTLFPDGGQTGCLYILISGAVDVSKGDSLLAKIREPGAILGEIGVAIGVDLIAWCLISVRCCVRNSVTTEIVRCCRYHLAVDNFNLLMLSVTYW